MPNLGSPPFRGPGYQPCDPQVICNRVNHVHGCLAELQEQAARRRAELEASRSLWALLQELEEAGVACLKIEGRMKRPEYTAIVTGVYSKVLREHRKPTPEEMEKLEQTFSRQGFTQGYFTGDRQDMFGVREESEADTDKLYAAARKAYGEGELRRVGIHFYTVCRQGEPIKAIAFDDEGNRAVAFGPVPERAKRQGLTEGYLTEQMFKTGGTPYFFEQLDAERRLGLLDDGPCLAVSHLHALGGCVQGALLAHAEAEVGDAAAELGVAVRVFAHDGEADDRVQVHLAAH